MRSWSSHTDMALILLPLQSVLTHPSTDFNSNGIRSYEAVMATSSMNFRFKSTFSEVTGGFFYEPHFSVVQLDMS